MFSFLESYNNIDDRISIIFREGDSRVNGLNVEYIYNSYKDGWFRATEGNAKGYGLLFKNIITQSVYKRNSRISRMEKKFMIHFNLK